MKNILRRSFLWKFGAGASATLASSAALSTSSNAETGTTENVLRKVHRAFERAMDKGLYEEVIGMFADDGEVVFNGGVFRGSRGVSRLYRDRFQAGKTGRRMEPAPGFELTVEQQHDSVEVSTDLLSAKAVFPYSIQVGMPFETETSLAAMARLHGEGVRMWWEGGVYRFDYRKDEAGQWKISRLEYDTLSRADYRPGKSYAQPIFVSRLAAHFPVDPQGPDELV
jgi:hypothetical protein